MPKERSNKERLNAIEKDLGDVKNRVRNDIPHALEDLKKSNVSLYNLINENAKINSSTLNAAMRIVGVLLPYTSFRGSPEDPEP